MRLSLSLSSVEVLLAGVNGWDWRHMMVSCGVLERRESKTFVFKAVVRIRVTWTVQLNDSQNQKSPERVFLLATCITDQVAEYLR